MHSADLLAVAFGEVINRSGIDPAEVEQVIGGCVSQVGQQAFNVARTAWLTAGLPVTVAATTVDSQCGSSQQATNLATSLVGSGVVDVAVACGVEVMSRVPMGASMGSGVGKAIPKSYFPQYEFTTQFEAAERIADKWGITREETDGLGVSSQARAADLGLKVETVSAGRLEDMSLEDVEAFLIRKSMSRYGNVSHAARALGLSRSALYRRLERYKL